MIRTGIISEYLAKRDYLSNQSRILCDMGKVAITEIMNDISEIKNEIEKVKDKEL